MTNALIIDQGGHSTRAIVFSSNGEILASISTPIPDALPSKEGFIEFSPDIIVKNTQKLLTSLSDKLSKQQLDDITVAGCIAQRSSLIACDKNTGRAITPLISWQDTRNRHWLEQQLLDTDKLHNITGLRPNAHAGFSKMRWLLDNHLSVKHLEKQQELLLVPWGAWFLHQLVNKTDAIVTDPILAARTGLTAYGSCQWYPELLSRFTIPDHVLPHIVPSLFHYGDLTLGKHKIPLQLLGGDQNFIPCAFGKKLQKQSAFINIGTGAFVQAQSTCDRIIPLLKTAIAISDDEFLPVIEGTVNSAATALDWWQQQQSSPLSPTDIDHFLLTVKRAPPFINTTTGTGSPWWTAPQPAYFYDNKIFSIEEKTVGILESILFACYQNLEIIQQEKSDIKQIIVSGGLAQLDNLCQQLANLTHLPVWRYEDNEASARGAAFYLLRQHDYHSGKTDKFTSQYNHKITERYQRWLEIMNSL